MSPGRTNGKQNVSKEQDIERRPHLIEKWLPIIHLSTEVARERGAASALPPINWLQFWWPRNNQKLGWLP